MVEFSVFASLAGGVLIGVASTWLLAVNGRIAGISGILHDLFRPPSGEIDWRVAFLGGLVLAGFVWLAIVPDAATTASFGSLGRLATAGVLVGVGTRMANGCTSGHGVCGLGRLSQRSLAAVLVFLSTGIATTTIARHVFEVTP
jgi:uncharacterized membrane protein YedE/YeeE